MAWLTVIGPAVAQVDYRLEASAGCGLAHGQADGAEHGQEHAQVDYRTDESNRLTWFGGGLAEVGITAGAALQGEADKDRARALMDGVHPATGEQLVKPKRAAHPASKLPAAPFLEHAGKTAASRGVPVDELPASRWGQARIAQMTRMVARDGETHRVSIKDLERLAAAAGVDLAAVYEAGELQVARAHHGETVRIGDRGFDLTIDIPKSPSVVWALADQDTAELLQGAFRAAVVETLADVEAWCGYGMRGEHGNGKTARRIETSGLLGWVMWHDVARPVAGQNPDPHLHAHAVISHMVRGVDGQWSTPGNGGREFHRHVETAGALAQARFRAKTTALGFRWERTPGSRVWELAGVPASVRDLYSKRAAQTSGKLALLGVDPATATTAQTKAASGMCREGKSTAPAPSAEAAAAAAGPDADLRASWRAQAQDEGLDAEAIVAAARPGGPDGPAGGPARNGPDGPAPPPPAAPDAEQIADAVFGEEDGLTSHNKVATRPRLLAAVLDELPAGLTDVADAEALADAVVSLPEGPAVPLPPAGGRERGPAYQTHPQRYTSADIVTAERTALALTERGVHRDGEGLAVVPAPVAAMALDTFEAAKGFALSAEQRAVVERLTGAGHAVDAVIGVAGSGKTTLMSAARTAWAAAGYTVRGATTAAVAAQALAAEARIPSQTITSLLTSVQDPERPGLDGVDVLVIDEAAMVDDRELARLLTAADAAGTKVALIGDPLQLKAIGVGGCFAAIHEVVDGPTLTQNRRQRDAVERAALQTWRDGDRTRALQAWADAGQVHAGDGREDTLAAMLTDWAHARAAMPHADAHDELDRLLVLAGTNTDVDDLNAGARAIRRAAGEITGPDQRYRLAGGGHLDLAVGDHVRVRKNDYRTRHKDAPADAVDVLNGYRGIITAFAGRSGRDPMIEWRRDGADGPVVETATLTAAQVANGELSHGTAMTVAAAQGQTGDLTFLYGMGLDPHALYPAMSRDRDRVDLYLPRALLESDADRIRHGDPHTPADELTRAITAYAATLQGDRADRLITPELQEPDEPTAPTAPAGPQVPAPRPKKTVVAEWRKRPLGAVADAALARLVQAYEAEAAHHQQVAEQTVVEQERALRGDGPAVAALDERRNDLEPAAAAEAEMTRLARAADDALAAEATARQQARHLQGQLARNPLALRLTGTPRPALRDQLADADTAAITAYREHLAARRRHDQLAHAAAAPYRPRNGLQPAARWRHGVATAELADLTGRWAQHRATAIDQDLATAPARAARALTSPARIAALSWQGTRTLDQARAQLTAVHHEIATRQALPHPQRLAEARERRQAAAEQAAARRAAQHHDHDPYQAHHPDGPSRGHGLSR